MEKVITIVKIKLVNGATPAARERSFSMAIRTETWLLLAMSQRRFIALAILNSNKSLVDRLPLVKVASFFNNSH